MIIPIELRYHPSDVGDTDPGQLLQGVVYEADQSDGGARLEATLIYIGTERAPAAITLNTAVELILVVSGWVGSAAVGLLAQALYDKLKKKPPGRLIMRSTVVEFEAGEIKRIIEELVEMDQANEEGG